MLNKEEVEKKEESLRILLRNLPEEKKKTFYEKFDKIVKDPDTYAVLNYFILAGLHHYYLGKWARGSINLSLFLLGFSLFFTKFAPVGIFLFFGVLLVEIYALFRSQLIIQDYNNKMTEKILNEIDPN